MAFAPQNPTAATLILFICIIAWGSYAPLRRTSNNIQGDIFGTVAFIGELTFAIVICFTLGSWGTSSSSSSIILDNTTSFYNTLANDVAHDPGASLLIVLGGALVGFGDAVSFIAFAYVPSSLAFPLVVGTCTGVGTTISYLVDGSERPGLLFTGVVLLIPSVSLLAWAQSIPPKKKKEKTTTAATTAATTTTNVMAVETSHEMVDMKYNKVSTNNGTTTTAINATTATTATSATKCVKEEVAEKKKAAQWKWIVLLISIGALNSSWGALSTVGRRNLNIHSSYFLLVIGRVGIQPFGQIMMQLIVYKRSPTYLFVQIWNLSRRHKLRAYGCGLLIGLGYYTYFVGSNVVNKSAAFAISNCSPLWTICLGVCVQNDLLQYQTKAKIAVFTSAAFFILAVAVLSWSG